jgi:hypothetical protein
LAFEWNDEWWKNGDIYNHNVSDESNGGQPDGHNDEEWFGLVDVYRNPKAAYYTLRNEFKKGQVFTDATPVIHVESSYTANMELDGKTVFSRAGGGGGARGINVGVLDQYTGIRMTEVRSFDTWASTTNFQYLINYINSLPNGTILIFAVADESALVRSTDSNVQAAYLALQALGSTQIRNVQEWGGWTMIAIKGQGALAEVVSAPHQTAIIEASVSLNIDPNHGKYP